MIKISKIFPLSLLFLMCLPPEPQTQLWIDVLEDPEGGYAVEKVTCRFEGKLYVIAGKPQPITATIEWWWRSLSGGQEEKLKTETHTFTQESYEEISTSYSASYGYVLTGSFWVKIKWQDKDKSKEEHVVESEPAYCYYE